ncbi:MAG TPA: isoprenylcysteine carboxylmethyltransferase family protein [Caulobacteraceae bacterium]|jgi:protein-S-isoprenylcysteine O-methyltransferase Ste14
MSLLLRAFFGMAALLLVMGLAVFVPAGGVAYWQGWAMLAAFFAPACAITIWLWFNDKALLERRVKAGPGSEPDPAQNVVQAAAGLLFLALVILPGLDHRWGWSHVPTGIKIAGDGLIVVGFWIVFVTFRANSFTAGTIELMADQTVIDTGPYALVRHPMYAGALVMLAGIPLALGSWWGLIVAAGFAPVLAWRLGREETFLAANLGGYEAYRQRVRYRLAPGVW